MSIYSLTEAYSEIYDPRKVEKIDDNFRFIDYMLDEDIEEVVESLVWEFRDYGNTLDESFDLLTYAASTEVITESYELIIEELLNEARVTIGRGTELADKELAKKQRREARRARFDGAISKVKAAMAGAKGGMGRASKALGGAVKKGQDMVGGTTQKGKALLGRLLRKGTSMAGQAVKSGTRQTGRALTATGRAISASGNKAAAAPVTTRSAKVGRTTYTSTTEPGGSKRQAVGSAVRKVGAALQRSTSQTPRMTKADYDANKAKRTAAAQAANADAFASNSTGKMKALPPARPETENRRAAVQRRLDTAAKGSTGGSRVGTPAPTLALPAKTSGKPAVQRAISRRKQEAAAKLQKAASGTTTRGTRFAGPNARLSSTRTNTGYREKLAKFATKLNNEDYEMLIDYIIEDIISSGYALDEMTALDIFENLTEDTVVDIALEYLVD